MSSSSHDIECQCEICQEEHIVDNQFQSMALGGMATINAGLHIIKHCLKTPKRDSILQGHQWVYELWRGNDYRFFENMRMRKPVLQRLISELKTYGGLVEKQRIVSLEESLAIFLLIVGQGSTYPTVEKRVQRSSQTIHTHFHMILRAVCRLEKHVVKPGTTSLTHVHEFIANNPLYYPHFVNCIGALDGMHIRVHVPDADKTPWMNRKGYTSTNVLGICSFDMCCLYAKVGNEGSMHDQRVLSEAMHDATHPFPFPPNGKYYLADAGYTLMKGFLTLYGGTRYHLPEFQANREFRSKNEVFNYRHSSLRSTIKRTFGVLKRRWRVLDSMPQMKIQDQIRIVWAYITLHNFIRKYDHDDLELLGDIDIGREEAQVSSANLSERNSSYEVGQTEMKQLRNQIRDSML